MAAGVIYLDIDDEITSAAARIRSVEGSRVAVVLPYGSRVATSRINFRLLARDALTHEKRLSVVSGDAASRALAASAGIPVFASVQEYEASLDDGRGAADGATLTSTSAAVAAAPALTPPADPVPAPRAAQPDHDATARSTTSGATTSGATTRTARTAQAQDPGAGPRDRDGEPRVRPGTGSRPATASGGGRRGIPPTPFLVAAAVLALVVVVGGVGAYLLLPSAAITLTPREESVGPLAFRVDASTDVTTPDIEDGVVPALTVPVTVEAANTFEATGERIEETAATGAVRFDNLDPTTSNTIAKGAIVSTNAGIRFRTDRAITVAAARLVGLTIVPSSASVEITAVDPGPEGNVQPNAITTVPRGEEPLFLKVVNPDETTGGVRETFPRIAQEDVDAAMVQLTETLQTDFAARLQDDDLAPVDVTVFAETAILGDPVWSLDPETLVGQEVETFDLGGSAQGSVLAVDTAPLEAIAAARLAAGIEEGFELIEGSSQISVDPAVVDGTAITFPVRATARQVAVLDADDIARRIKGLPLADAQAILDTYGTAEISVWPDWVTTIPTIDGRVTLTIGGAGS